jgi:hypothetical protein
MAQREAEYSASRRERSMLALMMDSRYRNE